MAKVDSIHKFKEMRDKNWSGIWAKRILSELAYLLEISESNQKKDQALLEKSIDQVYQYALENGAITKEIVMKTEEDLSPMKEDAKNLTVLLVAHAHIDMNWMWGFNETASLAVDTFRTMLHFMEEYPEFHFSQSQASVYKIVEKYDPELLEEIKKRVLEGRWEITASSWVENDKNMSGSEAMARQILYTKNYLSDLFDISKESMQIDFEPDTFGHNENMPEILNAGGVKYYYHCRGSEGEYLYRWKAPSGVEVLAYREPVWYNDEIVEYDCLTHIPSFCKKYGLNTAMKLFGVGDHGGGPTRKQIERFLEMQKWPLMPNIRFGTLKEFFHAAEQIRDTLPVVQGELNCVFTGCYTSQARIKRANMLGENRLTESEFMDAAARTNCQNYRTPSKYQDAWEKILFNQFHDILPGSGVTETREFAMGRFQEAMAASQINMNKAMNAICENLNTADFCTGDPEGDAFGAGVGFGADNASGALTGYVSRDSEGKRIVTIFNPTQYDRRELTRVILWDWEGDISLLRLRDSEGNQIPYSVLQQNVRYWDHIYQELLVLCSVKGYGYQTFVLEEDPVDSLNVDLSSLFNAPRVDDFTDMPIVMENEVIRVLLSPDTMKILSYIDKKSGEEQISEPTGVFCYILENPQNEMTAWRVGTYSTAVDICDCSRVRLTGRKEQECFSEADYEISFQGIKIKAGIILKADSPILEYVLNVDWREFGDREKGIPQLNFSVHGGKDMDEYLCAVPMGICTRAPLAQDVPCLGFMAGKLSKENKALLLMSDCKYGFRGYDNSVQVNLLRGSYDPDETPDIGGHSIRLGVGWVSSDYKILNQQFNCFVHPLYACVHSAHPGVLPPDGQFIEVNGGVSVTAVKFSEDNNGWILRCYNPYEKTEDMQIICNEKIVQAERTDILENHLQDLSPDENKVCLTVAANTVATIRIRFKDNPS